MGAVKSNDRTVAGLACPAGSKDKLFFDVDLKGFGIRVTDKGKRVWLFQYRVGKIVRRQMLGEWDNMTAPKARAAAEKARGQSRGGADPVADRKAARVVAAAAETAARQKRRADGFTVRVLVEEWTRLHLTHRSATYAKIAPDRLLAALRQHIDSPANSLAHADAIRALDAVAKTSGPIAANRARAYARACFSWAVKRGTLASSPFTNLPSPVPERSRERVLTGTELARVWAASEGLSTRWRAFIQLLILTGQRRSEVAGMTWDEISDDGLTWTISAGRAKNGLAHDVPLAPAAVAILEAQPRFKDVPYILSQGRNVSPSGFGKVKTQLDDLARRPDAAGASTLPALPRWTLHDLRRTMATGMQRLGIPLPVTEAVLNHVTGTRSGIVGVYQRHGYAAEKRAALEAWEKAVCRGASI